MEQSQIFISYQRLNQQFAIQIYNDLLSAGYWVWMDKRLKPAEEWEPQIDENLRKSSIFIVLISSKSVASDWVKHEGSMAFALNQKIVPVQIEPFGTYKSDSLPIWVAKIQLHQLFEGVDYRDKFRVLKQLLGTPLPIRQHLIEMLSHYQTSQMLLDEVALDLIQRHYNELYLTSDQKALADKLILESKAKLQSYWVRYDKLKDAYGHLHNDHGQLQNDHEKLKGEQERWERERRINQYALAAVGISLILLLLSIISFLR